MITAISIMIGVWLLERIVSSAYWLGYFDDLREDTQTALEDVDTLKKDVNELRKRPVLITFRDRTPVTHDDAYDDVT